jgi:putative ABC transport system permease protein
MPAAFGGGSAVGGGSADVWLPAQFAPTMLTVREARFLTGVGRMKPGVTIAQAAADLVRVQETLGARYPASDKGWSASVTDLKTQRVGGYARALWLAFAAVGLLLTIAIANIAGLLLVQLHRRARELAVRQAIGGSRRQIVGAVMTEVAVIAAGGSIAGAAAAFALVRIFAAVFASMPRMNELALDARGLAFAIAASAVAALVFGLWPTLMATRGDLAPVLAEGGRGASTGRHRLQRLLVASQIALSVVLLASAGLVLRSYDNLSRVDLGFDAGHAIAFHVGAAWDEDRARVGRMQIDLLSEIERLPGVVAAGTTNFLPATGATLRYQVSLDGFATADDNGKITIGSRMISRGYLRALGATLVAGDWCAPLHADLRAPRQAMINRAFADRYGPDLVGRTVRVDPGALPRAIVGVVGDLAEDGPAASAAPYVYACEPAGAWPDPEYVVRTSGDSPNLMPAVRAIVHRIDSARAIFGVKRIDTVIAGALDQPRLNARMLTLFATAAMALASLGLYSLLMLLVSERTREMGVRMALGAAPSEVARLVFAGAGRLLVTGVAVGLIPTAAAGRVLRAVLFGVSPMDGVALGGALLVLAIVTLAAAAVPARRAASLDPIEAIRTE